MLRSRLRRSIQLLIFISVVVASNYLSQWVIEWLDFEITPANEPTAHRIILIAMIIYTFLMSIPFVPGAEIGLAVMMVLGPNIVPLVYFATLAALSISFLIGRFIPERVLINLANDLRLKRTSKLLNELKPLSPQERLILLVEKSPKHIVPWLLKYRYVALLLAINTPGNIVIGGGGGIAMAAGMSRLFNPPMFLLTLAFAVSPVPLFLLLFN